MSIQDIMLRAAMDAKQREQLRRMSMMQKIVQPVLNPQSANKSVPESAYNRYANPGWGGGQSENMLKLRSAVEGSGEGGSIGTQIEPGWGTVIGAILGAGAGYFTAPEGR